MELVAGIQFLSIEGSVSANTDNVLGSTTMGNRGGNPGEK